MTDDDIAAVASYEHDPLGFMQDMFPWGEGTLAGVSGPRNWQADVAGDIGEHLQNPETRYQPLRIAIASGHGIGKSALISMIMNWALSTCEDTRIVVTANTEKQLLTKTWPEVGKWFRMVLNSDWWDVPGQSVKSLDEGHKDTWRADAVPWSDNNTEAFAGLHNKGKRIVLIFDEASNISDKVWEVAEGALTDEGTEIIWLAFGNPTRNTGRFRECFRKYAKLWKTRQIDSRDVEGTNKEYLQSMVDTYGLDSDMVKIRVRGMFPSMSAKQFISTADVDAAFGRHLRKEQYDFAPVILTCDPAWEGDDELVISKRQGLHFQILRVLQKNDNDIQIATILANLEDQHKADAVFVDMGYGTGIVSAGRTMNRDWTLVSFAGESSDPGCLNKRAEMWRAARDWLKEGGAIPKDQLLYDDLTAPETVARLDGKIQIEGKKDLKKRLGRSPDRADSLVLSFAFPVTHRRDSYSQDGSSRERRDYDPYA